MYTQRVNIADDIVCYTSYHLDIDNNRWTLIGLFETKANGSRRSFQQTFVWEEKIAWRAKTSTSPRICKYTESNALNIDRLRNRTF